MALSADVCHNWSLFALKKEEGKQGHQLTTPLSKVYKNSCSYSAMDILTAINFLNFFSIQTFLETISYAQVQKLNLPLCQDSFTCVTNTLVDPTVGKKKSKHYKQIIKIFMGILAFSRNFSCCTILGIKSTASPKGP